MTLDLRDCAFRRLQPSIPGSSALLVQASEALGCYLLEISEDFRLASGAAVGLERWQLSESKKRSVFRCLRPSHRPQAAPKARMNPIPVETSRAFR